MKVLAAEPGQWYLLEADGALFLDGLYNHSAYYYTFMIQLTAEEMAKYRKGGRRFLQSLSNAIQSSAPVVISTRSKYKDRDVSGFHLEESKRAVAEWNEAQGRET